MIVFVQFERLDLSILCLEGLGSWACHTSHAFDFKTVFNCLTNNLHYYGGVLAMILLKTCPFDPSISGYTSVLKSHYLSAKAWSLKDLELEFFQHGFIYASIRALSRIWRYLSWMKHRGSNFFYIRTKWQRWEVLWSHCFLNSSCKISSLIKGRLQCISLEIWVAISSMIKMWKSLLLTKCNVRCSARNLTKNGSSHNG